MAQGFKVRTYAMASRGEWRRGGASQQLNAYDALAQRPSELTDRFLELWGWGLLSTPNLQALAEGAQLD
eukprot:6281593-Lingulodinium_polyedra.AAC.1